MVIHHAPPTSHIPSGRLTSRRSCLSCCSMAHQTQWRCAGTAMVESMVCTIGHSNRSMEAFIGLHWTNDVARVIDVRTIPRSRHNPSFGLRGGPP